MPISAINGTAFSAISHVNGITKANVGARNGITGGTPTPEDLRVAAVNAATDSGSTLYYIKSDLSNVFQTADTSTPVTTNGQTIGLWQPVVGSITLGQTTSGARPTFANGSGFNRVQFDNTDDYLQASALIYSTFASGDGDDTTVIVGATIPDTTTDHALYHFGAGTSTLRYPFVGVLSTSGVAQAAWRGDDNTHRAISGTTVLTATSAVIRASKLGTSKKLFVNGVQEGSTNTSAVGTIANFTRNRIGSATTPGGYHSGTIALICMGKTLTEPQSVAIERYAAYLCGATMLI